MVSRHHVLTSIILLAVFLLFTLIFFWFTTAAEESILEHHEEKQNDGSINWTANDQQQFVILAGPHKTASSATQSLMKTLQESGNLGKFVWPKNPAGACDAKQFSEFVWSLFRSVNGGGDPALLNYYKEEFDQIWKDGKSIVIGAELFGTISLHESFDRMVEDALWNELPVTDPNRVLVVLNYRTPRLDHLTSLWAQKMKIERLGLSFREWACSMDCDLPEPKLNLHVINTLGQAAAFRRHGFQVSIVDMGGLIEDGLDATHTVACELLGVTCQNGRVSGVIKKDAKVEVQNVKNQERQNLAHLSDDEARQLRTVLSRLDMKYLHLRNDKHVRILHESSIIFAENSSLTAIDDKEACSLIKIIMSCNSSFGS